MTSDKTYIKWRHVSLDTAVKSHLIWQNLQVARWISRVCINPDPVYEQWKETSIPDTSPTWNCGMGEWNRISTRESEEMICPRICKFVSLSWLKVQRKDRLLLKGLLVVNQTPIKPKYSFSCFSDLEEKPKEKRIEHCIKSKSHDHWKNGLVLVF